MDKKNNQEANSERQEGLFLAHIKLKGGHAEPKYASNSFDIASIVKKGFIRKLLIRHNNSEKCVSVLNTGFFNFLDDKDLLEASLVCKLWFAEANSVGSLQERYPIRLNAFTRTKRKWIWRCILTGEDRYELETRDEQVHVDRILRLVREGESSSLHNELQLAMLSYHDEIYRDIKRTFPKLRQFQQSENQQKMLRVLLRISYSLPNVGYCQGMNYLVGIFLLALDFEEEDVYSSVMSVLVNWEYQEIYNKGLVKLREMCFVFNELIRECLPNIYERFFIKRENEVEITSELFAIQWFLTLFTYDIADTEHALNSMLILDNIVIHEPNDGFNLTVYKIALALFSAIFQDSNSEETDFSTSILEFIRIRSKEILTSTKNIGTLLDLSREFAISERTLQGIYLKYRSRGELQGDGTTEAGKASKEAGKPGGGAGKAGLGASLIDPKKLLLVQHDHEAIGARLDEMDEFSPFHPYFNI
ncbi:TBC domain-containing protein [Cryptosporidium felis]|nr:TBC domain-containing protein [Cryptosporidium felis]